MENLKGRRFRVVELMMLDEEKGIKQGDEGIILEKDSLVFYARMDKYNDRLRDANGLCEKGHGTSMLAYQIELLPEEEVKQVFKMEEKDLHYLSGAIDTLPEKARGLLWKLLDQVVTY